MKILHIIPARSGSKGLPGKNILPIAGKPMIAWSIEAAMKAKLKGDIIVSTDDFLIADVAKKFGAQVPFIRPSQFASDTSSTMDVVFHAIDFLREQNKFYDLVSILQPTSPLRTSSDVDQAIITMLKKNAKAVVGLTPCDHHPFWSNEIPDSGSLKGFLRSEVMNKNRQQLPPYFRINGAIYIGEFEYIKKTQSFIGQETTSYIMPEEKSVDIDTEKDLVVAEYYFRKLKM